MTNQVLICASTPQALSLFQLLLVIIYCFGSQLQGKHIHFLMFTSHYIFSNSCLNVMYECMIMPWHVKLFMFVEFS
jgi:hypothetical protein